MKGKLKPNKKYEDFVKEAENNADMLHKELQEALKKAHNENPNNGIGGYKKIEEPIIKKYHEKHIEILKKYYDFD